MRLYYTRRGLADLNRVLTYIEPRSPQGATNVSDRIWEIITFLLQHPHAGHLTSNRQFRRMLVSPYPYAIFYRVVDDVLEIHMVRHTARRPPSIQE